MAFRRETAQERQWCEDWAEDDEARIAALDAEIADLDRRLADEGDPVVCDELGDQLASKEWWRGVWQSELDDIRAGFA